MRGPLRDSVTSRAGASALWPVDDGGMTWLQRRVARRKRPCYWRGARSGRLSERNEAARLRGSALRDMLPVLHTPEDAKQCLMIGMIGSRMRAKPPVNPATSRWSTSTRQGD